MTYTPKMEDLSALNEAYLKLAAEFNRFKTRVSDIIRANVDDPAKSVYLIETLFIPNNNDGDTNEG